MHILIHTQRRIRLIAYSHRYRERERERGGGGGGGGGETQLLLPERERRREKSDETISFTKEGREALPSCILIQCVGEMVQPVLTTLTLAPRPSLPQRR